MVLSDKCCRADSSFGTLNYGNVECEGGVMGAGRIVLVCMVARLFFVVCCAALVFSRFGRSELKDPVIPTPATYNQTYPPVIEAAYKGDLNWLKRLLADDTNPNTRAFDNSTALHFSVRNGDDTFEMDAVRELFNYGARARVTDNVGMAPIHQIPAVSKIDNRNELIYMLFLHGADMNVRTYKQAAGISPLFNTYDANKQVISVDVKKINYSMLDILANNFDRVGVINLLENWGGLFPKEERERTRVFIYQVGFRDIADAIANYKENDNWIRNLIGRGLTILMIGALTNNAPLVKKELKDLNKVSEDMYRRTALHMAVMRHNPEIVEILLKAGANPAVKDYRGNTPLHQVAWLGDIIMQQKFTEMLLTAKASLTELNERRENILHHAIRLHDLPYVQYLMKTYKPEQLGTAQTNREGLTPYYLAEKLNFKDAMKIVPKR